MHRRLTPGLALLRTTGVTALVLLLWNPVTSRIGPGDARPIVLLDASLSMGGHNGRWREALDTARALAKGGGLVWRFGSSVRAHDSLPTLSPSHPTDGSSRLAPALAAAAGRGGPVVVVTDGAITDLSDAPVDLLRRTHVVLLPRPSFFDAFVASVDGPRRVSAGDTIRLTVSYGVAGMRDAGGGIRDATLAVMLGGRRLASRAVVLPDSGVVSTDLTLPASRIPHPGWAALELRLEGVRDAEPRDDGRLLAVEVSPEPSVVLLASPPDWDSRFLARTLGDVARVPLKAFVEPEPGSNHWRDAVTLEPVAVPEVGRAVAGARLVVRVGDPAHSARFAPKGAVLSWPTTRRQEGDWYLQPPGPSPLAGALAGIAWDSLPPAATVSEVAPTSDSSAVVVLTARLARRGPPRAVVVLSERRGGAGGVAGAGGAGGGGRRATIAASGLYRWAFRGGSSAEAYRALVAALADWLLDGGGRGKGERFVPESHVVQNGLPIVWRWTGAGSSTPVVLNLAADSRTRVDTLRFDATGRAELELPPGVYRYQVAGGTERGLVAVDSSSDEWRPAPPALRSQGGGPAERLLTEQMRDRWWLFALAIAVFAAEWAWRRRQGLP